MEGELILYQFSRSKVERSDFGHFLGFYAPDKLPTGRRLGEMMRAAGLSRPSHNAPT
jgi:hypothetical protein